MQTSNQMLMTEARAALRGKWGMAVVATIILLVLSVVVRCVPGVGLLISFAIGGPLSLGFSLFWLSYARNQEAKLSMLFSGFDHFVNAFVTYVLYILFILLWSLLLIVPGIIAAYGYAMSFFILADNPSMPASEVLKASKAMMQGNKMKLFLLSCRFIGWGLLCVLTFGIGFLWLIPYMQVSMAKFYEDIKAPVTNAPEPVAEVAPVAAVA